MTNRFQSAHEIAKVYHALADRESLQVYFLQSLGALLSADCFALYYAGKDEKLWLESHENLDQSDFPKITAIAEGVQSSGKIYQHRNSLAVPLVTGNTCLGVSFFQAKQSSSFTEEDSQIAASLSMEFASAVKSLQLMEENLRMARLAAIGQTSSMVVHELKNILQLARLAEEMLSMGLRDQNVKFVDMGTKKIRRALKEMDGFIWEMLSLARDQKLEVLPFALGELFAELEDDLQNKTKAASAILKWQVPSDFPEVLGDRRALLRAFLNLVKNAYEARRGDAIKVTLKAEVVSTEEYRVVIEDDGQGMTDETKARLFQAFYTTKGEHGTGLGLMIVHKTIALHQGRIEIESFVGKGTRFLITLPFSPVGSVISRVFDKRVGDGLSGK